MDKKRRKKDDEFRVNVGLVMNISLFLIILTFFILLNSIAVLDEKKIRSAIGSLTGSFGGLPGGLSPLATGESIMPPSEPIVEEEIDLGKLLEVKHRKRLAQIKLEKFEGREIITINESLLFQRSKHRLKASSSELLNNLSNFIKKGDYPVEIVGHTDDRAAEEKGYKSNWELSSLMAIQVLRYFVEKGKLSPPRLTAYGCGSHRPVASNDTRQSRAQNRRIDIVLNFKAPPYVRRIYRKKPEKVFTYKRFNFRIF